MFWGGYMVVNVLKWFWWCFNGYGYFWGMMVGMVSVVVILVFFLEIVFFNVFLVIFLIFGVGFYFGSIYMLVDDLEVLKNFY